MSTAAPISAWFDSTALSDLRMPVFRARVPAKGLDPSSVIRGAVAGWLGMSGVMLAARASNLSRLSITEMEGTFFAAPSSRRVEQIGFMTHLAMSLGIGAIYARGMRMLGLRPSVASGALGGVIHWAVGSAVVAWLSRVHPWRFLMPMPGFGGFEMGPASAIGFFVAHVVFGTLFGWQYGQGRGTYPWR